MSGRGNPKGSSRGSNQAKAKAGAASGSKSVEGKGAGKETATPALSPIPGGISNPSQPGDNFTIDDLQTFPNTEEGTDTSRTQLQGQPSQSQAGFTTASGKRKHRATTDSPAESGPKLQKTGYSLEEEQHMIALAQKPNPPLDPESQTAQWNVKYVEENVDVQRER